MTERPDRPLRVLVFFLLTLIVLVTLGLFGLSLSTLWMRTGVMPRWLCYISYAVALLMLFSLSLTVWMELWFPAWVLAVSTYFLIMSYRQAPSRDGDGSPAQLAAS